MIGLAVVGALLGVAGVWWWLEGSLRRDCRRLMTPRDAAALTDLERRRAAALLDLALYEGPARRDQAKR